MYHLIFPAIGTTIYLYMPSYIRIHPNLLFMISLLHNSALTAFSFYIWHNLFLHVYDRGIVFQHQYYFQDPAFDQYIFLFYLSKYYEYIDTLLLYLQGKQPIFLQKFHHIGAGVCWHLAYYYKLDGVGFITIVNSFIHTIMYSYYLVSLFRIHWIRKYKIYVTSLQLIQLSSAIILPVIYYPPNETVFNYRVLMIFTPFLI